MHRRAFPSDPSSSSGEKVQQFYRGHFRVVPNPGHVTSYSRQPHQQQKQQPSQHQQQQQQQHLMMIANNNRALKESLGISKMSPYHPFICRYSGCGSRYPHIHNLREHDRMHSRIKPFRCRLCGHRSSYQGALMKHLRRRHFPSMTAEDGQTFIAKLSCHVEVDEQTLDLEAIEMDQWVASGECRRLLAESDAGGFAINGINPAMRITPESGGAALRSAEQQQQQPPKKQQQLPGNSARVYAQLVQQFSQQQQQTPTGSGQSGRLVQVQHKLQPVGQQVQRQAEQVRQQEVMLKRLQYVQKVMASSSSSAATSASSSETYLPAKKMKFSRLVDAQQQRSNTGGELSAGPSSILHNRHSSSEIDFSSRASAAIAAAAVAAHTTRSAAAQLSSSNSFASPISSKALVVVPKNSAAGRQFLRQSSTLKRSQLAQVSHQAIVTLDESDDHHKPPPAKETEQQNDQAGNQTTTAADVSGKDDENHGGQETAEEEEEGVDENGDQQQKEQSMESTAENVDDPAHLTSSSSPVKESSGKVPALPPGTPSRATRASISAATEEAAAPSADDASTTIEHSSLLAKIDRRSLICKHCGRGNFASFRDYTFHDRTHSGLKPYTCTFTLKGVPCSNTFAQRCGVKVHVIKKHKGKRAGVSGAVNSAPFPDCYILEHTALIEAEKIRLAEELTAGIASAADADAGGD